jgi:hypothetical protein
LILAEPNASSTEAATTTKNTNKKCAALQSKKQKQNLEKARSIPCIYFIAFCFSWIFASSKYGARFPDCEGDNDDDDLAID